MRAVIRLACCLSLVTAARAPLLPAACAQIKALAPETADDSPYACRLGPATVYRYQVGATVTARGPTQNVRLMVALPWECAEQQIELVEEDVAPEARTDQRTLATGEANQLLIHIPQMAGLGWSIELIGRLKAAFPEIVVGIKDSAGKYDHTAALIEAFPGFSVFPGAEVYLLKALRAGAAGCISASANINARGIRGLLDRWQGPGAEALQEELIAVRKAVESHGMIPSLKAVLAEALTKTTAA